jgi:sphinganine-1-phosphate aldolase
MYYMNNMTFLKKIPKKWIALGVVSIIGINLLRYYRGKLWKILPIISKKVTDAVVEIKTKNKLEIDNLDTVIRNTYDIDTNILPKIGLNDNTIMKYINTLKTHDTSYKLISGTMYDNINKHQHIMMEAYKEFAYSNPMHGDIYNSVVFMERNIINMISTLLDNENSCGTITNGGTESLFLAVKTYRDLKKSNKPNIVIPDTFHCSIDKICHYLGISVNKIKTDKEHRVSISDILREINNNTICVMLSAPSYGFGIMDNVSEIAPILNKHNIPVHVDACLGGFIWMFQDISKQYSFHNVGVTSISVCIHKFGYSHKGVSTILYRNDRYLKYQYFATDDWDGGFYVSPSFLGSRSGGLVAQAWAGILSRGYDYYHSVSNDIINVAVYTYNKLLVINYTIHLFPRDLHIVSFSIGEKTYQLYDYLAEKGFILNALQNPPAIHLCITLQHNKKIIDELCNEINLFLSKNDNIVIKEGIAPIYGMRASIPVYSSAIMNTCLKIYLSSKYSKILKETIS